MWFKVSQFILRNRILILGTLLCITAVFGYYASTNIELDNRYGTMLPKDSEPKKNYELLKSSFGSSESLLIMGISTEDLYSLEKFQAWYDFGAELAARPEVDSVFSEAHIYRLEKDTENKNFYFDKVVKKRPETQEEVDSLREIIRSNPFYEGLIYSEEQNASLMMCYINEDIMHSMKKAMILLEVEELGDKYEDKLGPIAKAGMPHIRVTIGAKLNSELGIFIAISAVVTSILLFLFFRSLKIVLICLAVVGVGVVWSIGSIGLMDFKLSILMVLIPPLIIVITVPNCIFLINKYHQEIITHGNKVLALSRVIQKIGNATFLTNLTTALGFSTFIFTNSATLKEFGIISSMNIMFVFLLSITILPIVMSYSKIPKSKHLKHLKKQWLHIAVEKLEYLSLFKRRLVYIGSVVIILLSLGGTYLMHTTGNLTGDMSDDEPIVQDMLFIQDNFGGSIPFEILLKTKEKNTWFTRLHEIEDAQEFMAGFDEVSKSISVADGIKFVNMAYSNNNPEKYVIPSQAKLRKIAEYLENSAGENSTNAFLDSTETITRISCQVKDLGSYEIQGIVDSMRPGVEAAINPAMAFLDSTYKDITKASGDKKDKLLTALYDSVPAVKSDLEEMFASGPDASTDDFLMNERKIYEFHEKEGFNDSLKAAIDLYEWDIIFTGTSVVVSNGTRYLIKNLFLSLSIAIVLIGILMAILFRSWRMVLISLVPNLIPLLFTAGVMGFAGVPVKPSTILVFSIAFGISVDDTIHFLAKFRQELKSHEHDLRRCILLALRETGTSMIYTSIVLFFGFLMFTFSQFGGTKALGILVSMTLLIAMFANLIILPTLLLWMDKKLTNKALAEPMFELYDEETDIEFKELEIEDGLKKYEEEDKRIEEQNGNGNGKNDES